MKFIYRKGSKKRRIPIHYNKDTWDDVFYSYSWGSLFLYVGKNVIGQVCVSFNNNSTLFLHNLVVNKDYRKNGYGSALLREVEKRWKFNSITLFVDNCDPNLIRFYESNGYKIDNLNDENDLLMTKKFEL